MILIWNITSVELVRDLQSSCLRCWILHTKPDPKFSDLRKYSSYSDTSKYSYTSNSLYRFQIAYLCSWTGQLVYQQVNLEQIRELCALFTQLSNYFITHEAADRAWYTTSSILWSAIMLLYIYTWYMYMYCLDYFWLSYLTQICEHWCFNTFVFYYHIYFTCRHELWASPHLFLETKQICGI